MNESESWPKVVQADRVCLSGGEGKINGGVEGEVASWPLHVSSSCHQNDSIAFRKWSSKEQLIFRDPDPGLQEIRVPWQVSLLLDLFRRVIPLARRLCSLTKPFSLHLYSRSLLQKPQPPCVRYYLLQK